MNRTWMIALVAALIALLVGAVWLYNWDIPAPQDQVSQELSDDVINK